MVANLSLSVLGTFDTVTFTVSVPKPVGEKLKLAPDSSHPDLTGQY